MKGNNRSLILSVIAVVILVLIAIGTTYAFFATQIDKDDANIKVDTSTTSETKVVYNASEALNLANAEPGDKVENTFNIVLTASNKTDDTVNYSINWIIEDNNFVYEPENATDAQLVYSIYYSDDNATWTALKENQDCTTSEGTVTMASNQELTATVNTTNTVYWKIVLEYKAYDYNQATNMSKNLTGHIEVTGLE